MRWIEWISGVGAFIEPHPTPTLLSNVHNKTKRHVFHVPSPPISYPAAAARPACNTTECDNLTRLDLVKHSVRAVIAMLTPEDRFGLVAFASDSETVLELTKMDEVGE